MPWSASAEASPCDVALVSRLVLIKHEAGATGSEAYKKRAAFAHPQALAAVPGKLIVLLPILRVARKDIGQMLSCVIPYAVINSASGFRFDARVRVESGLDRSPASSDSFLRAPRAAFSKTSMSSKT